MIIGSDKLSKAPIEKEKTEIDSSDKKTDGKSDTKEEKTELKETIVDEETPMETNDIVEESKVEVAEKEKPKAVVRKKKRKY
ncbi:hypothetical protein NQ314_003315 [Rhamnusium bicolor]|uniref:Uncharacterized protein n=1 Tax=Rhamnusium bicolor TaxID=1586634 RepID=A0AAV8ZP27_9CUCU|nr:hypothetical protein NQ314_003315 [Rhamnusium bicolor]